MQGARATGSGAKQCEVLSLFLLFCPLTQNVAAVAAIRTCGRQAEGQRQGS